MKKVTLLGMVLVLCLAAVGIGYAGWVKDLDINGTVNTGTYDVVFEEAGGWDTEATDKNVSEIQCVIDAEGVLQVTLIDAYPCIDYYNEVDIHCVGTVPAHIYAYEISETPLWLEVELLMYDEAGNLVPLVLQPAVQIHYCETFAVVVHVHLTNDAPEDLGGATAETFTAKIFTGQYNEF